MSDAGSREFLWPDYRQGPWWVGVEFGMIDGKPECVGFSVRAAVEPLAINATVFRSFKIGSIIEEARKRQEEGLRKLVGLPTPTDLKRRAQAQLDAFEEERISPGGRPVQYGPDHFAKVAKVYVEAASKPTLTVGLHFNVSQSTAAKWVARARKLGLLAPTTRGKRGGTPG